MRSHSIHVRPIPFTFGGVVVWRERVARLRGTQHAKDFYLSLYGALVLLRSLRKVLADEATVDKNGRAIGSYKRHYKVVTDGAVSYSRTQEDGMGVIPPAFQHYLAEGKVGKCCETMRMNFSMRMARGTSGNTLYLRR